jgi:ATP-dependent Clp endopeptidase proteolytic subunit ClpP
MKSWFTITNKSDEETVIDINDEIGAFGISSNYFADQIRMASPKKIKINIDSPGGDCNDGFTIYDAIMACGASVSVDIVGLSASMASVIMLAADKGKLRIAENGRVMIHRVTGGAHGNSDDLAAAAQLTKQFEDRIVALYVERSGKSESEIRDLMKAQLGTWFFGKEAVAEGFADEVIPGAKSRGFKSEWASLFTMLPAAIFIEREKELALMQVICDKPTNAMEETTPPAVESTPAEVTPEPAPAQEETTAAPVDSEQIRNAAVLAERERTKEIRAWAGHVSKIQNIDLSDAVDTFIENGQSLAEFKEHVISNSFKAIALPTPTDTTGAAGKTMKREHFTALSPYNQAEFCRKGGKITD